MSTQQIEAIEKSIARAKVDIEIGQALERLKRNQDFKKIVLDGYFRDEAIRLVHLKSDPNMTSPEAQRSIVSQMDAIGTLSSYFNTAMQRAALALKTLTADEEMRDELLQEELTNE